VQEQQVSALTGYLGALSAVLVGVAYADGQITSEESGRIPQVLNQSIPQGSKLYDIARSLLKGVQKNRFYVKYDDIATLASILSESEKLLLIASAYDIAMADGGVAIKEQQYLEKVAHHFEMKTALVKALEQWFMHQSIVDGEVWQHILDLLNPARFQTLDPVFINAASQLLSRLPASNIRPITTESNVISYNLLEKFHSQRETIATFCGELNQVFSGCRERASLPSQLGSHIQEVYEKSKSRKFRIAVVGEFSQGKSTLLNALLGEEIQPVRAIPCSGVITVLRHGQQKRAVCRYQDGREEEIPFNQYQVKAAMTEEAAMYNREDGLTTDLLEIVLEHPGLELCRHGVEIVDSPGLNEHPERTRITNQLIADADAVIFLANASRPMTQGERELLQDLRVKLNGGQVDQPAPNLFVLMNFMDLLRTERDRQQVHQLVEHYLFHDQKILENPNRLHFVSAQAALDALSKGTHGTEYLESFHSFTQSLERFLTVERGEVVNRRTIAVLKQIAEQIRAGISQAQAAFEGKLVLSEESKQQILAKLGEASGFNGKLQDEIRLAQEQQLKRITNKLPEYGTQLQSAISTKAQSWTSTQTDESRLLKEFSEKFSADLLDLLVQGTQELTSSSLKSIDSKILQTIYHFQASAESIDQGTGSQLVSQLNLSLNKVAPQLKFNTSETSTDWQFWNTGLGSGIGLSAGGVLLGGAALAVSSIAFFPVVLTGGAIAGMG
jgi:tellurite resistance protein